MATLPMRSRRAGIVDLIGHLAGAVTALHVTAPLTLGRRGVGVDSQRDQTSARRVRQVGAQVERTGLPRCFHHPVASASTHAAPNDRSAVAVTAARLGTPGSIARGACAQGPAAGLMLRDGYAGRAYVAAPVTSMPTYGSSLTTHAS